MPNPNPTCSPTVDFQNFSSANTPVFRIKNPDCTTSSGDFLYSLSFTDGSHEVDLRSVAWSAGDSSEDFTFQFSIGAKGGRTADDVYNIKDIRCTCQD